MVNTVEERVNVSQLYIKLPLLFSVTVDNPVEFFGDSRGIRYNRERAFAIFP